MSSSNWRQFHFPRLQYAGGTYLEREDTQNGCNVVITWTLKWWRRGESEFCPQLIPLNLLIPLNEKNAENT